MALVAATIIGSLRAILALFPGFSARFPVKKYSALIALIGSAFYLLISGADVAAQRSFVMLSVMLLAVTVDRAAISMRNLAIAALLTIALSPTRSSWSKLSDVLFRHCRAHCILQLVVGSAEKRWISEELPFIGSAPDESSEPHWCDRHDIACRRWRKFDFRCSSFQQYGAIWTYRQCPRASGDLDARHAIRGIWFARNAIRFGLAAICRHGLRDRGCNCHCTDGCFSLTKRQSRFDAAGNSGLHEHRVGVAVGTVDSLAPMRDSSAAGRSYLDDAYTGAGHHDRRRRQACRNSNRKP